MINHIFISFSAVQICEVSYIHLHSSPSTGILRTHKVASSQWFDSSLGRALHRYRRSHGFESRLGLNFFQALISQLLKLLHSCDDQSYLQLIQLFTFDFLLYTLNTVQIEIVGQNV